MAGRVSSTTMLAVAALVAVICAVTALVLVGSRGDYIIHAQFEDAGQLVTGGEVQLAGRRVGSISNLSLTRAGLADVTLSISDSSVVPLHRGTRAMIRAVGQAGVANRFVQLAPGSVSAPILRDGATLPTTQTDGIVDLDAVLDTFDPRTRASMQQLIAHSAQVFAGSGSRYFNQMLGQLDPALGTLDRLSGQIAGDRLALGRLVRTGATAAGAVASRSTALEDTVAAVARTFDAIASERTQLADLLQRTPAVLGQARGTLSRAMTAVRALRPTLRALVPVGPPLRRFLGVVTPTLGRSTPVVRRLIGQLSPLRSTLEGLGPLEGPAVSGLRSTTVATRALTPILTGIREYGSDLVLGVFNGLGGLVSGPYTSQGHYAKLNFVQSPQTVSAGPLSQLLSQFPLAPGVIGVRTHLLARCPGGDAPPAPDGSNPWIASPGLCNPADDLPLSVDFP
jgi:phospholipid/cholesterol/gamma-HCH transport system substrate-binding protein